MGIHGESGLYQGEEIGWKLADLVGEHGIEGVEILHGHGEVVGTMDEALAASSRSGTHVREDASDEVGIRGVRGRDWEVTGKGSRPSRH